MTQIIEIIIGNTVTAALVVFIFNVYRTKVDQNTKDISDVKTNYVARFQAVERRITDMEQSIRNLITERDREYLEKLHLISEQLGQVKVTCALIHGENNS